MGGILVPKPMLGRQLRKGHRSARSLVSYWLFNEGSGNRVEDLSGNGRHINLVGMPWKASYYGFAPELDEDGDELSLTANPLLIPDESSVTFFALIDVDSFVGGSPGFFRTGANGQGTGASFIRKSDGYPRVTWKGNNILDPTSGTTVPTGLHFHVVVFKNREWVGYYIDGKLEHSANTTYWSVNIDFYHLGWQWSTAERLRGRWILAGFYTRALSASEIAELYLRPFAMFDREPLPLWTAATQGVAPPVGMAGAMTTNTGYWGW